MVEILDYPKCGWCEETVFPWEEDDKFPKIKDGSTGEDLHFHVECQIRFSLGSRDHMMKICTCYGGAEDGEEGLTKREAAQIAFEYFNERVVE